MKVEDLMLGDWVRGFVPDSNSTIYGIFNEQRVAIIAEPSKAYIELSIDDIQPIPLTPDILIKNGFVYTNNHTLQGADTYICCYKDYKLIYKLGDYFAVDSYDDRYYRLFETQFCHKWSVHELQHALRLCGIEKTIELQ